MMIVSSPRIQLNGGMPEPNRQIILQDRQQAFDPEIHLDEGEKLVDWDAIFGRKAPLALEIGTGNGMFLVAEASRHPEENLIGIERSKEFFGKFKKRVIREGISNIRCMCVDVTNVFPRMFAPASLGRIICNFSDPWPKRRHRERRVFRPGFIDLIEGAIAPGGTVAFKTDVGWYFNLTIAEFRRRAKWRIVEAGPAVKNRDGEGEGEGEREEAVVTNFERKAREVGSEVWEFVTE